MKTLVQDNVCSPIKGEINIFDFVGHKVSVGTHNSAIDLIFRLGLKRRDGLERRMWGKFQSEETVSVKVRRREGPMAV